VLLEAPHVARIASKDPAELWADVTPDSSRRLLLAALDAFATLGFAGATTREIAARAHMSPAAVYVHYEAKLDLLQDILEVAYEALLDAVTDAVDGVEGAGRRLRVIGEALAAWHACNHTLARVAHAELQALPEDRAATVDRQRRRLDALVRAELRRGIAEDGFSVPDMRGTTLAILSLGIDLSRWYSPRQRGLGVEELAKLHGELVVRMVRPWGESPAGRT
jgi:AcrR family transcriptional regulator